MIGTITVRRSFNVIGVIFTTYEKLGFVPFYTDNTHPYRYGFKQAVETKCSADFGSYTIIAAQLVKKV